MLNKLGIHTVWRFECRRSDGSLRWVEEVRNITVNVGLDDMLDKYFKGSGYTASFFMGLKDTGAPVAADTMASHASWPTITPYSNATDPAATFGVVASQSVSNSASPAVFNINATDIIFGAFLKDNNTKGGITGLLFGVANFAASQAVVNLDTLNVTVTITSQTI